MCLKRLIIATATFGSSELLRLMGMSEPSLHRLTDMYMYICTNCIHVHLLYIHVHCLSDLSSWGERVESILIALLTFCQRNSSKLASEDKARQVESAPHARRNI